MKSVLCYPLYTYVEVLQNHISHANCTQVHKQAPTKWLPVRFLWFFIVDMVLERVYSTVYHKSFTAKKINRPIIAHSTIIFLPTAALSLHY